MLNGYHNRSQRVGWRLRVKAGALALFFAFLTLLPWLHAFTAGQGQEHACCHHETTTTPNPSSLAIVSATDAASDCWICEGLSSLLHHNMPDHSKAVVTTLPSTSYTCRAPQAPFLTFIDPACRSQAPPSLV
jgi:hypothetical protein